MSIQILDCTLRDGGYVNDWNFGRKTIAAVIEKLAEANIDIIECGFLTGMVKEKELSLFNSIRDIKEVLPGKKGGSMYVAMIAIGEKELEPSSLEPWDGSSLDGIRLTFHREETAKAIKWAHIIKGKGYKVFMQPVGTVFYGDMELLYLTEQINGLSPYAFYIVDTLGSMYRNQVTHKFHLIDQNMNPDILLGFHGHNNMQLAFSNAQVLGNIQSKRTLILDSSVFGMGRGAGNLPTELIAQYINKNICSKYDVTMIMDIYDEYIKAIRKKFEWGYSVAYHIAASSICHPDYASYLINKQTLTMKDIKSIIQSIPPEYKVLYDKELIEALYSEYQSRKIDDSKGVEKIGEWIRGRKILLLAPGKTIISKYEKISEFVKSENPFVISVNFIDGRFKTDACFVSNRKRMELIKRETEKDKNIKLIATSNIADSADEEDEDFVFADYDKYTNDDPVISDNAGLMLLKLLEKCRCCDVYLAGFDGFRMSSGENYYRGSMDYETEESEAEEKQERITRQLEIIKRNMKVEFLTPSLYESKKILN